MRRHLSGFATQPAIREASPPSRGAKQAKACVASEDFAYAGERLLRIGKRRVCRGKVCFQLVIPAGHAGRESGTVTADVLGSTRRLVRVHARRDVSGARKVRVGRGGAACPLVRGVLAADALCERWSRR
jgi:hypothetical protein